MITVNELSVIYGDRALFNKISFFVGEKDRIGLTGKNGAGKSTLMKTIIGEVRPSEGTIAMPKGKTVGYLPQQMKHNESATILEEASKAFEEVNRTQERLDEIGLELGTREDYESVEYLRLIEELNELNDRITLIGGDNTQEKAERVLKGLGFEQEELGHAMSTFSGGWKMRVELAKILLSSPDLILLDEPTNHLDIESIEWLEGFLIDYPGAVILISHDRDFLDNITRRTIELSNGKAYDYKFSYSKYIVQRKEELDRQKQAAENQKKYIDDTQKLINKFRAKKNKAAFAQGLIKKLEKLDIIEVDDFDRTKINISFPPAPHSGKVVVKAEDLSKSFGDKHVFSGVNLLLPKGTKMALVGKNGAGKSTFLKILTGELEGSGKCELGHKVSLGYFAQDEAEKLDEKKTVFETIDDEAVGDIRTQVRNILGSFLFSGDDIDKKVSVLSGGERTRLAICKLLLQPHNLIVMDEPTNHLDLVSKDVLKHALNTFDGTIILVSHDRNFLHGLARDIYELKPDGLRHYVGDIYDFLKEKRAESIAEFEQKKKTGPSQKPKVKTQSIKGNQSVKPEKLSYEERKSKDKELRKLKNKVERTEKEIEQTEESIEKMNETLATLDYSDADAAQEQLDEYNGLKSHLDWLVGEWENAENRLAQLKKEVKQ
ncbi:MAG: ATP-binding cassette domain-containing protein [Flavobacteriales bacterium]|nr:ATP-binding cassette domain-containing protein [Flavobacteriales bacterium]